MSAMEKLSADDETFEFLHGRAHRGVALPNVDDRKAIALKLGRELGRVPGVYGKLTHVCSIQRGKVQNLRTNHVVVGDIAVGPENQTRLFPRVIRHVVAR